MHGSAPTGPAPASGSTTGWATFDTRIGVCGIAWGEAGITGVALPADSDDAAGEYLRSRYPAADEEPATSQIEQAIERIRQVLDGARDSLADLELDYTGVHEFPRRVYEIARTVEPGSTITYGEIAAQLGGPGLARAVGRALGDNPFPIVVPCHRVLGADGAIGGFSASGGARTKRHMLLLEGAGERDEPGLFGATEIYGP